MSKIASTHNDIFDYYEDLVTQSRDVADRVSYLKGSRDSLKGALDELKNRVVELNLSISQRERIVLIFGKLIESLWGEAKKLIEDVMPYGLRLVFGDELDFKIESDVAANQAVADLIFLDHGHPRDIAEAEGGSVSDIVSTLLRMIVLLRSGMRRVVVLDEPFKQLDMNKVPLILRLLNELSDILGVQIIMVTHHKGFQNPDYADKIYVVEKIGGKTKCSLQS